MSNSDRETINKTLEELRRKLFDTSTRNRLIHVNRENKRANCLNIINERADAIYDLLRIQEKRMRFEAMGKDKTEDGEAALLAVPEQDLPDHSKRFTDRLIGTPLGLDALARRLLRLARDAKTAEEEQGLSILYLAVGFLRWRESASSEVQREAPLILLPVQLVRNAPTSTYDVQCRDDDITTNLNLSERLKEFGIVLPEIPEGVD